MLVVRLCSPSKVRRAYRLSKSCACFVLKNTDLPVSDAWTRRSFKHRRKKEQEATQILCKKHAKYGKHPSVVLQLLLRPKASCRHTAACGSGSTPIVPNDFVAGKAVHFAAACVTTREVRLANVITIHKLHRRLEKQRIKHTRHTPNNRLVIYAVIFMDRNPYLQKKVKILMRTSLR